MNPEERSMFGDPEEIIVGHPADLVDRLAQLRPDWWQHASCRGVGVEVFYPPKGQRADAALQLCGRCPALIPCRNEAITDADLDHGWRGGMSPAARKAARRNRQTKEPTRASS